MCCVAVRCCVLLLDVVRRCLSFVGWCLLLCVVAVLVVCVLFGLFVGCSCLLLCWCLFGVRPLLLVVVCCCLPCVVVRGWLLFAVAGCCSLLFGCWLLVFVVMCVLCVAVCLCALIVVVCCCSLVFVVVCLLCVVVRWALLSVVVRCCWLFGLVRCCALSVVGVCCCAVYCCVLFAD